MNNAYVLALVGLLILLTYNGTINATQLFLLLALLTTTGTCRHLFGRNNDDND